MSTPTARLKPMAVPRGPPFARCKKTVEGVVLVTKPIMGLMNVAKQPGQGKW